MQDENTPPNVHPLIFPLSFSSFLPLFLAENQPPSTLVNEQARDVRHAGINRGCVGNVRRRSDVDDDVSDISVSFPGGCDEQLFFRPSRPPSVPTPALHLVHPCERRGNGRQRVRGVSALFWEAAPTPEGTALELHVSTSTAELLPLKQMTRHTIQWEQVTHIDRERERRRSGIKGRR